MRGIAAVSLFFFAVAFFVSVQGEADFSEVEQQQRHSIGKVSLGGEFDADEAVPEDDSTPALPKSNTIAAEEQALLQNNKKRLRLQSRQVRYLVDEVEKHLVLLRKGCVLPDAKRLDFPITAAAVTGDQATGAQYDLSFGWPLKPSSVAFNATVLKVAGTYAVKGTNPPACSIKRSTEDSPESETYLSMHQRKVADEVGKRINAERIKCKKSALVLKKSHVLAIEEQMVSGVEYIVRMQLADIDKKTDVVVVKARLPPTTADPTKIKIILVRPSSCELFPAMDVPVEGDGSKAKTDAEEEQAEDQLEEEEYIRHINNQNLSWKAAKHPSFGDMSFAEWGRSFTGLALDDMEDPKNQMLVTTLQESANQVVPASFDWRTKAPKCVNKARVRNQGGCGSCYAFAKTGILSHRICIATNAAKALVFSPRYMVSCKYEGLNGCSGGVPKFSGKFLIDKGIPTERCVPYHASSSHTYCRHHCKPFRMNNGTVVRDPWEKWHAQEGSHARVVGERQMQLAILAGGPIEGTIKVYPSFKAYHSGVYFHPEPARCQHPSHINCCLKYRYCFRFHKHKWDKVKKKMYKVVVEKKQKSSGHAFMIVGWGAFPAKGEETSESEFFAAPNLPSATARRLQQWHVNTKATARFPAAGKKYWICENSWGQKWGYGGFFLVQRGIDTAYVETLGAYTLQPGHKVMYKHNSRCKCNAHGDLAMKGTHIITGAVNKKLANKCRCDLGWGGDKCQNFCADGHYKGSQFCSTCNQQGDCTRCRSGKNAKEKQVLGNGKCWTQCQGSGGEKNRIAGKCYKADTFPCANSATTRYEFQQSGKCVCKPGWGGPRCQYPKKCLALKGAACSTCTAASGGSGSSSGSGSGGGIGATCATPACRMMGTGGKGKNAGKCVAACSGNGFKVNQKYTSKCICKDGFGGNECQLDCAQAGRDCLSCTSDGVCLARKKAVFITAKDGNKCIQAAGGKSALLDSRLSVVVNDFSVNFYMKGSNWKNARLFDWYGTQSEAVSTTDEYNTGQVALLKNRRTMLSIGVRYFKKSQQGELTLTYGGGSTPQTFVMSNAQLKRDGVNPNSWVRVTVVVKGLDKKIHAYVDGKPAGTFKLNDHPPKTIANNYAVAPGGFWGYIQGISVSNTALPSVIAENMSTKTAAFAKCNTKCIKGCKGKCMFGGCVCKRGFTGSKCDVAATMAVYSSPAEVTHSALRMPSPHGATGRSIQVAVPIKAPAGCVFNAADIAGVSVKFANTKGVTPKRKCYRTMNGAQTCYTEGKSVMINGAFIQVYPPKGKPIGFMAPQFDGSGINMYASEYKASKPTAQDKLVAVEPNWELESRGPFKANDVWKVAVTKKDRFSQNDFQVSPLYTMTATITLKTAAKCASGATSTSANFGTKGVMTEAPKNPCLPNPCGQGTCALPAPGNLPAGTPKYTCTCHKGWDKSTRLKTGVTIETAKCDYKGFSDANKASCGPGAGIAPKTCKGTGLLGNGCFSCLFPCTGPVGSLRVVSETTRTVIAESTKQSASASLQLIRGTLEVCRPTSNGKKAWGTICDDTWGNNNVKVACNQMGFQNPVGFSPGNRHKSPPAIGLDDVNCQGTEARLDKCAHSKWGKTDCSHSEDVILECGRPTPPPPPGAPTAMQITSGTCVSNGCQVIATKNACSAAAKKLAWPKQTAAVESTGAYPPRCYQYSDKSLWFNTGTSGASCTGSLPCACLCGGSGAKSVAGKGTKSKKKVSNEVAKKFNSGTCASNGCRNADTKQECVTASIALGWGSTASVETATAGYPTRCYKYGKGATGSVWFNQGASPQKCQEETQCACLCPKPALESTLLSVAPAKPPVKPPAKNKKAKTAAKKTKKAAKKAKKVAKKKKAKKAKGATAKKKKASSTATAKKKTKTRSMQKRLLATKQKLKSEWKKMLKKQALRRAVMRSEQAKLRALSTRLAKLRGGSVHRLQKKLRAMQKRSAAITKALASKRDRHAMSIYHEHFGFRSLQHKLAKQQAAMKKKIQLKKSGKSAENIAPLVARQTAIRTALAKHRAAAKVDNKISAVIAAGLAHVATATKATKADAATEARKQLSARAAHLDARDKALKAREAAVAQKEREITAKSAKAKVVKVKAALKKAKGSAKTALKRKLARRVKKVKKLKKAHKKAKVKAKKKAVQHALIKKQETAAFKRIKKKFTQRKKIADAAYKASKERFKKRVAAIKAKMPKMPPAPKLTKAAATPQMPPAPKMAKAPTPVVRKAPAPIVHKTAKSKAASTAN